MTPSSDKGGKEPMIYTWRGRDIETLNYEECRQALRQAMKDLIRERAMHTQDNSMRDLFLRGRL